MRAARNGNARFSPHIDYGTGQQAAERQVVLRTGVRLTLTSVEHQEVETALFLEDKQQRLAAVARMTAEQLHAFMREYNWDDGFAIPP